MNRQVVHSALGRSAAAAAAAIDSSQCIIILRSSSSSRPFSTTSVVRGGADNVPPPPSPPTTSSSSRAQRSEGAVSKLGQLARGERTTRSAPPTAQGAVDARSLGVAGHARAGPFGAGAGAGAAPRVITTPAGNVLNLRSLRGRPGGGGGGAFTGDRASRFPSSSSSSPGRGGGPAGAGAGGTGTGMLRVPGRFQFQRGPGAAGGPPGSRFGPGGLQRGGRRPGGAAAARRPRKKKPEGEVNEQNQGKLTWSADEQAFINKVEQGVVTEYTPEVTLESLAGYGPALATETKISKVETALRTMRILGGGRPFDNEGVTVNTKDSVIRYYHEKKPLFMNSVEEKEWLESSKQGFKIYPPTESTKSMIVEKSILGVYGETPKFVADVKDTMGMLASYHARDFSYKSSDAKKFDDKIRSLLAEAAPKKKQQQQPAPKRA
ncbi:hypothetical protein QBC46DRAFT_387322 [Diplogelasinospora grovesii]|uniref:Uncharacterized protein n=1 Tax=Diplogelasinospora grovesii TaxID=303347 RepID=A0AAN6N5S0_9PEZI|nr:hypothetical protein QBC46DRAFT_387322 [Diplogelasinospora grovesii]